MPAKDIDLTAGAAFTIFVRIGSYALVAVAGIVVARALGAHGRGVYSLATTVAIMFAAFAELGISKAGILAGFSLALTKVAGSSEALQPEPRS